MTNVTIRSQGQAPICYGVAAAQLFDAWRFSHGDTRYDLQTSAIASVVEDSVTRDGAKGSIVAGYPGPVLETLLKHGACSQSDLEARFAGKTQRDVLKSLRSFLPAGLYSHLVDIYNWENERQAERSRITPLLKYLDTKFQTESTELKQPDQALLQLLDPKRVKPADIASLPEHQRQKKNENCVLCAPLTPAKPPSLEAAALPDPSRQYLEFYRTVGLYLARGRELEAFHQEVVRRTCPPERRMRTQARIRTQIIGRSVTQRNLLETIHQRLAAPEPRQPVAIGYCQHVLTQGRKADSRISRSALGTVTYAPTCAMHESVIMGQRSRGGRCQLLIRDSWGASCAPYSADWECEHGKGLWVDADVLMKNAKDIAYLE